MSEVDWGSAADWVSGLGTVAAVFVALRLATAQRNQQREDQRRAMAARSQIASFYLLPKLEAYAATIASYKIQWLISDAILDGVFITQHIDDMVARLKLPADLDESLRHIEDFGVDAVALAKFVAQSDATHRAVCGVQISSQTPGFPSFMTEHAVVAVRAHLRDLSEAANAAALVVREHRDGKRL